MTKNTLLADKPGESSRVRSEKQPRDWLVVPKIRLQPPDLTLARSQERVKLLEGTNLPGRRAIGVGEVPGFRLFETEAYEPGPYVPGQQKVRALHRRIDSPATDEAIDHWEARGPDGRRRERQSLSWWFRHQGGRDGFMGVAIDYYLDDYNLDEKLKSVTTTIRIPGQTDIVASLFLYWGVDGQLIGREERQEDHHQNRGAVRGARLNAGDVDVHAATYADPGNHWGEWWSKVAPEEVEIVDPNSVIDQIDARTSELRTKYDRFTRVGKLAARAAAS